MRSKEYDAFVLAFDNIDVRVLSDKELQSYADICEEGLLEAQREIYKRRL